jgi:SET domain-containing protein
MAMITAPHTALYAMVLPIITHWNNHWMILMSELKQKLLQHLNDEVFCRLGASPMHGVGVFAIRRIPKGINPLNSRIRYKEVLFSREELKQLPSSVKKLLDIFCYYKDDVVHVPEIGMNAMDMALYLNHSKTPNVRYLKGGAFETLRSIRSGEEITMDYDISFGDVHIF